MIIGFVCAPLTNRADPIIVWGSNSFGQTNVPTSATNVIALAAGDSHCLALRADGTVIAWAKI
jgi:alpha-tubulin suppressor-like RCC1 family protein